MKDIIIKGAKEHNLKNIDINIPRNKMVVITGLSGSGKSSLAFDTLYAEGQRRYVESLSAYARQFLEKMHKPNVEHIEGLSPAISIEQRTGRATPRSTVGTTTEIYDYLRLLFARIGSPHCHKCGQPIYKQTPQEIIDKVLDLGEGTKVIILAPIVRGRKGEYVKTMEGVSQKGYQRMRIDGDFVELVESEVKLDKNKKHTLEVVIDRLAVRAENKTRIAEAVEKALEFGEGLMVVHIKDTKEDKTFSELNSCLDCDVSYGEFTPRMFSFNSPYGACEACHGLGTRMNIDAELVINRKKSLSRGAVIPWFTVDLPLLSYNRKTLESLAKHYKFSLDTPFEELSEKIQKIILYGSDEPLKLLSWKEGKPYYENQCFEGVLKNIERRFNDTTSTKIKEQLSNFMTSMVCPDCGGARLKPESLAVTIEGKPITEINGMSISAAVDFFTELKLSGQQKKIAAEVIKEIKARLQFMFNVGLGYLTLDRRSNTLAGGEAQRIRLATQIGSKLVGVLYVLDEPSIGLHARDNERLLKTLLHLKKLGNSVIVVEHDEDTILAADHVVDLGPGAGKHGGYIVAQGTVDEIKKEKKSLTAQYLNGEYDVYLPVKKTKKVKPKYLKIKGAQENNLKNIDVSIPLQKFVCVTGVSGSGKSTLVDDILRKALKRIFYKSKEKPGKHKNITGLHNIDKVTTIDQSPIGRTPRSNPATYTGLFTLIRDLFAELPESKMRGYKPGRFSFNVKGGRCEACTGDGIIKIDMHFLPTVYVECEVCKGHRFNRETLEILYKGKNISDILESSVSEALEFFRNMPKIHEKLQILSDVGLGYVKLGQPATTLSGGEAQRIKLAAELSVKGTGNSFYILDEPTTGLHFADIDRLLKVLRRLVEAGNTVLVVEHNLDVIRSADYLIDLGPEGGDKGGTLVASGTPEEVMKVETSYTGKYLKAHIDSRKKLCSQK